MDTLVLSHAYVPVARVGWRRALTLLFAGKVEVVEEYQDRTVRSVTFELKVPSIVRFLRRVGAHRRVVRFSRANVYARDRGRCQYCGRSLVRQEVTYDHVVPRSQRGRTSWDNVVICCMPCNQRKGGRTPAQAGMRLHAAPTRPERLPETLRLTFLLDPGVPASWRQFAQSYAYWNAELERDDAG